MSAWFTYVPQGKNVISDVAFSNSWFEDGFALTCFSIYGMKMLAKETAVFVPYAVPWICR